MGTFKIGRDSCAFAIGVAIMQGLEHFNIDSIMAGAIASVLVGGMLKVYRLLRIKFAWLATIDPPTTVPPF